MFDLQFSIFTQNCTRVASTWQKSDLSMVQMRKSCLNMVQKWSQHGTSGKKVVSTWCKSGLNMARKLIQMWPQQVHLAILGGLNNFCLGGLLKAIYKGESLKNWSNKIKMASTRWLVHKSGLNKACSRPRWVTAWIVPLLSLACRTLTQRLKVPLRSSPPLVPPDLPHSVPPAGAAFPSTL